MKLTTTGDEYLIFKAHRVEWRITKEQRRTALRDGLTCQHRPAFRTLLSERLSPSSVTADHHQNSPGGDGEDDMVLSLVPCARVSLDRASPQGGETDGSSPCRSEHKAPERSLQSVVPVLNIERSKARPRSYPAETQEGAITDLLGRCESGKVGAADVCGPNMCDLTGARTVKDVYAQHPALLLSCKDGSPRQASFQSEDPSVTQRDPHLARVRLCVPHGGKLGPDKYDIKTPLDVGGPPAFNRSSIRLSTTPAKKKR
ncbi:hypothetical protein JOQ06_010595 [Pogonophryne albipinna]|uniref:Uncharacterized protein n=1 Tax=Pogonophryne albipinna TaxID=1090488 RepID=A0AAD6FFW1_9TELE|nr:hypothetical protein JOQ06_010595 [Pogonophryne albipinna]